MPCCKWCPENCLQGKVFAQLRIKFRFGVRVGVGMQFLSVAIVLKPFQIIEAAVDKCFFEIDVLKKFCQTTVSLFLTKLQTFKPVTLLKRLRRR